MNLSELDALLDKIFDMGISAADIAVMKDNKMIHRKTVGFSQFYFHKYQIMLIAYDQINLAETAFVSDRH